MATEKDLQEFTTQVTCPDDFDDFWAGTLEMLSGISLKPVVTEIGRASCRERV